jgi:hypothetical protein
MTSYEELEWLLYCLDETKIEDPDATGNVNVAWELTMAHRGHEKIAMRVLAGGTISDQERKWAAFWTRHDDSIWVDDYAVEVDLSPWPELLEHARWLHALRVAFTKIGEARP